MDRILSVYTRARKRLSKPTSRVPSASRPITPQRSRLCALPDEVVLQIMQYLDGTSLLCLRRTCRLHMRLFGDKSFTAWHGLPEKTGPWQSENSRALINVADHKRFLALINRDRFCSECAKNLAGPKREAYNSWAYEFLHCRGCLADHRAYAFSPEQRRLPPHHRICMAREGYGRTCPHQRFKWERIERRALKNFEIKFREEPMYTCRVSGCKALITAHYMGTEICVSISTHLRSRGSEKDHDGRRIGWLAEPFEVEFHNSRRAYFFRGRPRGPLKDALVPSASWYHCLDPTSTGLLADVDSYGITWCKDWTCPNYYLRHEPPGDLDISRPCGDRCPWRRKRGFDAMAEDQMKWT